MVRFKNRYLLVEIHDDNSYGQNTPEYTTSELIKVKKFRKIIIKIHLRQLETKCI